MAGINDPLRNFRRRIGPVDRMPPQELTRLLEQPPPVVEIVSPLEVYQLDTVGERRRRICGAFRHNMPIHVPEGIPNPYGVDNPRSVYRCLRSAGHGTTVPGTGPCRLHWRYRNGGRVAKEYMLGTGVMEEQHAVPLKGFDAALERVKATYTPEKLWDLNRVLVDLEAMRIMLLDSMQAEEGKFSFGHLDELLKIIRQILETQVTQAKRDQVLLEKEAVRKPFEAAINGMVAIVLRECGDAALASRILKAFKDEVLLALTEHGFTELLRRQQMAGISGEVRRLDLHLRANEVEAEFLVADNEAPDAG